MRPRNLSSNMDLNSAFHFLGLKQNLYSKNIYIYIYIVLFGPVKPELRVIPLGQENHSGAEHLNFPGRELSVIDFTEQYFFKEKTKDRLL